MRRIGVMIGVKAKDLDKKDLALELIGFLKDRSIQVFCLEIVADWLGLDSIETCKKEEELVQQVDLVITVGGDGTILYTARFTAEHGVPLCGLNMGRLGFLSELCPTNWQETLGAILGGKHWIDERSILSGQLIRGGQVIQEWVAVTDVVLARVGFPHMITVEVSLNGEPMISYPGDGVIVATPTGTTAYSLSAGGPIVSSDMDAIVVTPICAHDFYARPWVLNGDTVVELQGDHRSENYGITVDGEIFIECLPGDRVRLTRSPWKVKLMRLEKASYYRNLRSRFHRKAHL